MLLLVARHSRFDFDGTSIIPTMRIRNLNKSRVRWKSYETISVHTAKTDAIQRDGVSNRAIFRVEILHENVLLSGKKIRSEYLPDGQSTY